MAIEHMGKMPDRSFSIHDNDDKLTCLHLAVWCNQADTVRLLLQLGADPNQVMVFYFLKKYFVCGRLNEMLHLKAGTWLDYTGTPWDFALQYKNAAIMDVFRWVEISDKSAIFILNKVT